MQYCHLYLPVYYSLLRMMPVVYASQIRLVVCTSPNKFEHRVVNIYPGPFLFPSVNYCFGFIPHESSSWIVKKRIVRHLLFYTRLSGA
jgi:hypothetical protein